MTRIFSAGLASLALALTSLINIVPASAITINPDQYGVSVQTADNEWTSLNFLETPNSNRLSATVSLAGAANLLDQNWSVQITMPGVDPWTVSSYDPTKTFDIGEKTPGTRIELRLSASQTFTDGSKREIDRGTYLDVPSLPQLYFGVSRDGQSWETGFKLRDNISTGVLGFAGSLSWRSSSSSGTKSIPTTTNSAVHVPFTARNADDEYELSLQGTIYREDNGIKSNYYNFTTTETFAARAFPQCRVDDQVFPSSGIAIHEGNDDDPHRISSDYDLVCMQQLINLDPDPQEDSYLTSHTWQITSDIDLSAASATDPSGWTPIGANVDGLASITITGDQLRTIKGLKVAQDANYMGLFGWTGNIEAANLNLESFNVQGDEYVGALVGKTSKANINHVLASGTVSGTSTVAGLIGYLDSMVDQTLSNIVVYDGDLNVSLGGLIHAIYSTDTTIGGVTHYGNLYHWSGLNSASSGSFNPFVDDDQYSYPLNGKSTSCSDLTTISWWNQLGFPASTVNLPFRCLATLITSNSNLGNLSGAVGETLTYSDHTNTSVYRYPAKSSKVDFYVSNNPSAASKISDLTISNDQTSATILDAAGYLGTYVYSLGLDLPAGIALISDSNTLNATFADRGNDPYLKTFDLVNYANNDVGLTWEIDQSQADGSEATFKLIDPRGGVTPTTVPNKLSDTSKIGVKTQPGTYTIDATFKMPITGGGTATERQIKTFTTPLLSDFGFIASQDTSSDTLDLHYEFDQAVTGALNISASNLTDSSQFLTTTSEASREKAYAGLSIPMQMGNQYQAILDGSVTSQDASYSFYENRELTLASFSDFGITQKTLGDYTVTYALRNTVSQALQVSYSYFKKTGVVLSCDPLPDPDSSRPSYSGDFQCHTSPTNPQLDSLITNFYPQAVGTITSADPSSGRLLVQSVMQWSEFTPSIYAPTSSKDCGYTFQTDNIAKHRGTAQDPYLIANVNDLNCMRQLINNQVGNFSQFHYWEVTQDFDLSSGLPDPEAGWRPIGLDLSSFPETDDFRLTPAHPFTGVFYADSSSKTLRNLQVSFGGNSLWGGYFGLFGSVNDASISNLTLENFRVQRNSEIDSTDYLLGAGTLAGQVSGHSTIANLRVQSGTVENAAISAGVVGLVSGPDSVVKFDDIVSSAQVNSDDGGTNTSAGGILGQANSVNSLSFNKILVTAPWVTGAERIGAIWGTADTEPDHTLIYHWDGLSTESATYDPFRDDDTNDGTALSCTAFLTSGFNLQPKDYSCFATLVSSNTNDGLFESLTHTVIPYWVSSVSSTATDNSARSWMVSYPANTESVVLAATALGTNQVKSVGISVDGVDLPDLYNISDTSSEIYGAYTYTLGGPGSQPIISAVTLSANFQSNNPGPRLDQFHLAQSLDDGGIEAHANLVDQPGKDPTAKFKFLAQLPSGATQLLPTECVDQSCKATLPKTMLSSGTIRFYLQGTAENSSGTRTFTDEGLYRQVVLPGIDRLRFIQQINFESKQLDFALDYTATNADDLRNLTIKSSDPKTTSQTISITNADTSAILPNPVSGSSVRATIDGTLTNSNNSDDAGCVSACSFTYAIPTQSISYDFPTFEIKTSKINPELDGGEAAIVWNSQLATSVSATIMVYDSDNPLSRTVTTINSPSGSFGFAPADSKTTYTIWVRGMAFGQPSSTLGSLFVYQVFTQTWQPSSENPPCDSDYQTSGIAGHAGTAKDPFLITSDADLLCAQQLIESVGPKYSQYKYWQVTQDIDLTSLSKQLQASGRNSVLGTRFNSFGGHLYAVGPTRTFKNLQLQRSSDTTRIDDRNLGLIGTANDLSISNLALTGLDLNGRFDATAWAHPVGGLIGTAVGDVTLDRVLVEGSITNVDCDGGGLIGKATQSVIVENSIAQVTLNGSNSMGGLIGAHFNNDSAAMLNLTIANSVNLGDVENVGIDTNVAALVGGFTPDYVKPNLSSAYRWNGVSQAAQGYKPFDNESDSDNFINGQGASCEFLLAQTWWNPDWTEFTKCSSFLVATTEDTATPDAIGGWITPRQGKTEPVIDQSASQFHKYSANSSNLSYYITPEDGYKIDQLWVSDAEQSISVVAADNLITTYALSLTPSNTGELSGLDFPADYTISAYFTPSDLPHFTRVGFQEFAGNNDLSFTYELSSADSYDITLSVYGSDATSQTSGSTPITNASGTLRLEPKKLGVSYTGYVLGRLTYEGTSVYSFNEHPRFTVLTLPNLQTGYIQKLYENSLAWGYYAEQASQVNFNVTLDHGMASPPTFTENSGTTDDFPAEKIPGDDYAYTVNGSIVGDCNSVNYSSARTTLLNGVDDNLQIGLMSATELCNDGTYSLNETRSMTVPGPVTFNYEFSETDNQVEETYSIANYSHLDPEARLICEVFGDDFYITEYIFSQSGNCKTWEKQPGKTFSAHIAGPVYYNANPVSGQDWYFGSDKYLSLDGAYNFDISLPEFSVPGLPELDWIDWTESVLRLRMSAPDADTFNLNLQDVSLSGPGTIVNLDDSTFTFIDYPPTTAGQIYSALLTGSATRFDSSLEQNVSYFYNYSTSYSDPRPAPPPECPEGTSGIYPNCEPVPTPTTPPTPEVCPDGSVGTYPDCEMPYYPESVPVPTSTQAPIINHIPSATGPALVFTDTNKLKKARRDAITWLSKTGVTIGDHCLAKGAKGTSSKYPNSSNCHYLPTDPVKRGAMAQFLQKLAGWTDSQILARYQNIQTNFTDLSYLLKKSDHDYNPARYYSILWLADTGITVGCKPDGSKFCPKDPVKRGAMAEFIQKFAGVTPAPANSSSYPDVTLKGVSLKYGKSKKSTKVEGLSPDRIGAINWLKTTGITQGSGSSSGKTTFKPQEAVNRGAMAEFMKKLAQFLTKTK